MRAVLTSPTCRTSTPASATSRPAAPTTPSRPFKLSAGWPPSVSGSCATTTRSSSTTEVGHPLLSSAITPSFFLSLLFFDFLDYSCLRSTLNCLMLVLFYCLLHLLYFSICLHHVLSYTANGGGEAKYKMLGLWVFVFIKREKRSKFDFSEREKERKRHPAVVLSFFAKRRVGRITGQTKGARCYCCCCCSSLSDPSLPTIYSHISSIIHYPYHISISQTAFLPFFLFSSCCRFASACLLSCLLPCLLPSASLSASAIQLTRRC